jgi:dipeptidyl aminopeptidase/acylaminoacyl peptidase
MGKIIKKDFLEYAARAWSTVRLPRASGGRFYAQDYPRIQKKIALGSKFDISIFSDIRIPGVILLSRNAPDAPPALKKVVTVAGNRKWIILKFKLPRQLKNGILWIVSEHVTKKPRT